MIFKFDVGSNEEMRDKTNNALFELIRAGLWEHEAQLKLYDDIDFDEIMRLAEEQSVIGLVTAGLELVKDVKVPQTSLLQFIGYTIQLEQRNKAMNAFIVDILEKLRQSDIYTLLVKGQGIAQCYKKPLWRTSGDIDFFLSSDNYNKAKSFFIPLSSGGKPERQYYKEWGLNIAPWYVELHGTQRTGLSTRVDMVIDEVQRTVFYEGKVRSWINGNTIVFLPAPDEDVFFVFVHFVKHFYKEGGVSVRQLCDWCRLLWTYRDQIDVSLLENRLRKAGLMSEWRSFASLVVQYLGMPIEAMPLFNENYKLTRNTEKVLAFILKGGEWRRFKDTLAIGKIFPANTIRFLPGILLSVTWLKVKERYFK